MEALPLDRLAAAVDVFVRNLTAVIGFRNRMKVFGASSSVDFSVQLCDPQFLKSAALDPQNLTAEELGVELIRIEKAVPHSGRSHTDMTTSLVILGKGEGFPDPRAARILVGRDWRRARPGERIYLPLHTPYGIEIDDGGLLYMLRFRSPPRILPRPKF